MQNKIIVAEAIFQALRHNPNIERYLTGSSVLFAYENAMKVAFNDNQRDPKEPGRDMKINSENKVSKIIKQTFSAQKKIVLNQLEEQRGNNNIVIDYQQVFGAWGNNQALIGIEFMESANNSIQMFGSGSGFQIDWTGANTEAAVWAGQHAGELIDDINSTTQKAIQTSVENFITQSGYTIGQVVQSLPFNDSRAWMIAVTEITRAYATASLIAGQQAQAQFPDLKFYKTWFTNEDEKVCPICGSFSKMKVLLSENFVMEGEEISVESPPGHPNCRCWMTVRSEFGFQ